MGRFADIHFAVVNDSVSLVLYDFTIKCGTLIKTATICFLFSFGAGCANVHMIFLKVPPSSGAGYNPVTQGSLQWTSLQQSRSFIMAAQIRTLVSAQSLLDAIKNNNIGPKLRILDASWYLAKTKRNPKAEFAQSHIPGASFFDIDGCCDKNTELDHMLPTSEEFSEYVGKLGIGNDTQVVVYDTHGFGAFSAPRVWWMFRVFGHDMVSLLDGGMKIWQNNNYPVTAEYTKPEPQQFKATLNKSWVKKYEDIVENVKTKEVQVVDARSAGRFRGTEPEPREDVLPGHYPGTINIPFNSFLDESGKVKAIEDLAKVFKEAGVDVQKPLWATCGSGVTACHIILAAHLLGHPGVCLYDGSWTEWFKRAPPELIISEGEGKKY